MRLVGLILLLLPSLAFAEPVSLITSALSSTAFTVGTIAVSWGTVVFTAASLLYGQATARKQQQKADEATRQQKIDYNSSLQAKSISGVATEFPHRYVYGVDRVGGNVVAIFTSGARDEFKHVIAIFAQQESESIDEIYLNKVPVGPLDANGFPTGGQFVKRTTLDYNDTFDTLPYTLTQTPGGTINIFKTVTGAGQQSQTTLYPYTKVGNQITAIDGPPLGPGESWGIFFNYLQTEGMVRIIKHLGVPGQIADPFLQNEIGRTLWPNTATLDGHTYIYIQFNLYQAEFQGGLVPIEALMHGKKILDLRTSIVGWSDNNSLVAYDYLTSELGGVLPASVPQSAYIAAANDCDDVVSTGAWTGKRYTFNGTVTADESREQVLEGMAQSMAGGIVATTWDIYAGKWTAPVMDVLQDDIVGEVALSPGLARNDVFNTVKGQYAGPDNDYTVNDYKPYQNESYLDLDGEELITDIQLPYTNEQQRCTNLARIFTEQNRNSFGMTGRFSLKLFKLRIGDRVTFTSSYFGQSGKVYRLTDKSFAPDRAVLLSFKEDAESIYDLADETSADSTPNTGLPNPFDIDPLTSLVLASGDDQLLIQDDGTIVSRILATWDQTTSPGVIVNGNIELEYQRLGSADWQAIAPLGGGETSAYIAPVEDGQFYNVRVRAFNPYLNVRSDWTYAEVHQVIGKTAPPPDVTSFTVLGNTFFWLPVEAVDLAGYEVRFNYGNNPAWGTGTPLQTGLITESPWTPLNYPAGPITVMIKAIDTSGNYSQNAASIITNLGEPIVANLILSYDDKAAGFPGVITGGAVVSGGDLEADDSGGLFWGADEANFWGADGALFWPTSTYEAMQYVLSYDVSSDEAGSRLTLLTEIEGESYTIEYRFGTSGTFWGADDAFYWGADASPFWPPPTEWTTWPGAIENIPAGQIQFRITTQAGTIQGAIRELTLQFDVEDETEFLNDIVIAPGGTRLPIVKSYRSIKNILMTSQAVGGTTPLPITLDKHISPGPLVAAYVAGVSVAGLIDAQIQGVKGN